MTNATIAEKISKLLKMVDSSTHPEEADTFMAKAHALMQQHGISLLELEGAGDNDPVGMLRDPDSLYAGSNSSWKTTLASQLAVYYGCELVWSKGGTATYWTIFGRQSARTTFEIMWPFVLRQVMATGRQQHVQGHYKLAKQGQAAVGLALAVRVCNLNQSSAKAAPVAASNGTALVPVSEIGAAIQNEYGEVKPGRARTVRSKAAARSAAATISINKQASGKKSVKVLQ